MVKKRLESNLDFANPNGAFMTSTMTDDMEDTVVCSNCRLSYSKQGNNQCAHCNFTIKEE